ncbi:aminoglycoside adenylyltransferase domain-containing protein [Paenibacillus sp. LPE1-1-1.1]|uniref:aminoglycoside adenylyltransferase domain-containing protein n=1 Tax=Paenibacillus sp. LPE1-1-1.1 TaxID=3135230 RepID=UPI00343F564B
MTLSNIPESASSLPNSVIEMLRNLKLGIQEAIGDELIGLYLRGSLALGDFDPLTSDIDFLAVTKLPVSEVMFTVLNDQHSRLANITNVYADQLEGAYFDLNALKRFRAGERYPTIERGDFLRWRVHHSNWILERWTVREHGITLFGPDPKNLIEPISVDEIRAAVSNRLRDWADWANQLDDPNWYLPLSHKAYVVETMCRAIYTLKFGEVCSKQRSVKWALEILPERWRSLVDQSQAWRTDTRLPDPSIISEVMQFVHWVAFGPLPELK